MLVYFAFIPFYYLTNRAFL